MTFVFAVNEVLFCAEKLSHDEETGDQRPHKDKTKTDIYPG